MMVKIWSKYVFSFVFFIKNKNYLQKNFKYIFKNSTKFIEFNKFACFNWTSRESMGFRANNMSRRNKNMQKTVGYIDI